MPLHDVNRRIFDALVLLFLKEAEHINLVTYLMRRTVVESTADTPTDVGLVRL